MDDPITPSEPLQTPTTPPAEPTATPPAEPAPPAEPTLLSEPTATPPAEPPPPAEPTVLDTQVSLVKPDGTFIDGWQDRLPEELRGEECLKLVPDFNEMVKQFVNQRKAIGKDKVILPNEKSDENEWNMFYEAIGRPKTHTGYKSPDIPEELKDIFTESRLDRAKERAYALGATQKQFDNFLKGEIAEVVQTIAEQDEAELKAIREERINTEKELRDELGGAFNDYLHWGNRVLAEGFDTEAEKLEFQKQFGNKKLVVKLLGKMGSKYMAESEALRAEVEGKVPTQIQQRIKEIESNPKWRNINSDMSADERQQLTEELTRLYKQLHPAKAG